MVDIDGSRGEGGGQVLRTSLSLSCLLGVPFRMVNIRSRRKKPGLMPQHLSAVRAAAAISGASTSGAEHHSTTLEFRPHPIRPGKYRFDIGTAGASSLVLQTVLLPLLFADSGSSVTVTGGTHVPMSPPATYLRHIFLPALERLGVRVPMEIRSYGFYPVGGGETAVSIRPVKLLHPLRVEERGELLRVSGISAVGNLPRDIAARQRESAVQALSEGGVAAAVEPLEVPTPGHGTFLFLQADFAHASAGFIALGERGKRAETVGAEAAAELLRHLGTRGAFDPHLADQIALYLALAPGRSVFTTSCISSHLLTNLEIISMFHPFRYAVEGEEGEEGRVVIDGKPPSLP